MPFWLQRHAPSVVVLVLFLALPRSIAVVAISLSVRAFFVVVMIVVMHVHYFFLRSRSLAAGHHRCTRRAADTRAHNGAVTSTYSRTNGGSGSATNCAAYNGIGM